MLEFPAILSPPEVPTQPGLGVSLSPATAPVSQEVGVQDQVGPICGDAGPAHRQCVPLGPNGYPRGPACASRLAWDWDVTSLSPALER